MNIQSKLKKVTQSGYDYIYIYFKFKGKIIRINTGNKVVITCMNKDFSYNSKFKDYLLINEKTNELKSIVDKYLYLKNESGQLETINQKECTNYIRTGILPNIVDHNVNQSFDNYLIDFYEFKRIELNNRQSSKDYLTLHNSLKDYQRYNSTTLNFKEIDTIEFLVKYRHFLSIHRDSSYLTIGGLNDNTINKRFCTLKTFLLWIEGREIYQFKKTVHKFKTPKYDNNIIVLDKDELKILIDLKIENPFWRKIIDVFVCNCFLGLRYSDLSTLSKKDFVLDEDGDWILIKENKKTGFYVQILVQQTSLTILKKYDFNLPVLSQPYFNRELKVIFDHYDLFSEMVVKKRRVNKVNEDREFLKRELITTHTCRRTFITLSISNNVPINSLMLSSGHKKIQTIQHYMKKILDKNSFKNIDLSYQ